MTPSTVTIQWFIAGRSPVTGHYGKPRPITTAQAHRFMQIPHVEFTRGRSYRVWDNAHGGRIPCMAVSK